MKWSEENQLKLIEVYKTKPILWNPKHNDYFKKNLKEEAWNEIENEMDISAEHCKKKIVCLLSSNRRERNKVRNSLRGGLEVYKSRWFAYEALAFLRERGLPSNKTETLDGENEETQIQAEEVEEEIQTKMPYPTWNYQNEVSFAVPKRRKRAKTKDIRSESNNLMTSAFQLLQTATAMIAPPSEDDEVTAFFKYVTTKVNTFPPETRRSIQKAVFDILMKTDQGINGLAAEYDDSTQFSPIPPLQSPSQRSHASMASGESH